MTLTRAERLRRLEQEASELEAESRELRKRGIFGQGMEEEAAALAAIPRGEQQPVALSDVQGDRLAAQSWVQEDVSRAEPRTFDLLGGAARVLSARGLRHPSRRADVFPRPPKFIETRQCTSTPQSRAAALDHVRACVPLAIHFEEAAMAHLAALERKLFADESLDSAQRSRIRAEITKLEATGRPIWETWIEHTRPVQHQKFDRLVRDWLNEPPSEWETDYFHEDSFWLQGVIAAAAFFGSMPACAVSYLGIDTREIDLPSRRIHAASLRIEASEFNVRAREIGARLQIGTKT